MTKPNNIAKLPTKPGVYIFKNNAGKVIYIGKAKNLKKRVASYFKDKPTNLAQPIQGAIDQVKNIKHIITDSEIEALVLEASLIKQHKPKYNVSLKDDKNYQYIKIDWAEDYPKLYTVREVKRDRGRYFGPFASGKAVKDTMKLLRRMFPYRSCNRAIFANKAYRRACLNHHIRQCLGPCIGAVTKKQYRDVINNCSRFLSGQGEKLVADLKKEMQRSSGQKDYEQAACLRDQIQGIDRILARQKMVTAKGNDQDIISLFRQNGQAYINLFTIRNGRLLDRDNFSLDNTAKQTDAKLLSFFIQQFYSQSLYLPQEIVVPVKPYGATLLRQWLSNQTKAETGQPRKSNVKGQLSRVRIIVPQRGKKLQLLKLGVKNAREYSRQRKLAWEEDTDDIAIGLDQLKEKVGLLKIPERIEAYDISNIQGELAVGSMIVFTDGKPDKSQYRRFRIKTIQGANDVGMMREVLDRRLQRTTSNAQRATRGRWPKPDLILVDGGKPQLNAARDVLETHRSKISLAALAKREERLIPDKPGHPGYTKLPTPLLHLLQRIRDEAHRFAIGYHHIIARRKSTESQLDQVPGIGPATRKKLLRKFGSVVGVTKATRQQLSAVCGDKKAQAIKEHLSNT